MNEKHQTQDALESSNHPSIDLMDLPHSQDTSSLHTNSNEVCQIEGGFLDVGVDPNQKKNKELDETVTAVNAEEPNDPPYTIFTTWERYAITAIASFLGLYSSVSIPIYLPALPTLKEDFNITTEQINLTVVTYSIFQGLGPAFWSPMADKFGRRPIYIICILVYIGACVGLALANSYGMLLGMRALQATGMATTVALGSGVVGDMTLRKDRGTFMGIFTGITLVGGAIGPIIGGGLTASLGWRSIFWFLVISAGVSFVLTILLLPETGRSIVGNGRIKPHRAINQAPSMIIRNKLKPNQKQIPFDQGEHALLAPPKTTSFLRTYRIVLYKDVAAILLPIGLHYTLWFMVITAQSTLLMSEYNFSALQVGISYLGNGIGSVLGSLISGNLMNYLYRRETAKYRQTWLETHGPDVPPDMSLFDIQSARLKPAQYVSLVILFSGIIFGWTIQYKVHWIVPVFVTLLLSFGSIFYITIGQCLMVDLFPDESSTASACLNVVRCLLCASGLAVVDKMISALGSGGAFTLMAGIVFLSWIGIFLEMKHGQRWDRERRAKEGKGNQKYL